MPEERISPVAVIGIGLGLGLAAAVGVFALAMAAPPTPLMGWDEFQEWLWGFWGEPDEDVWDAMMAERVAAWEEYLRTGILPT